MFWNFLKIALRNFIKQRKYHSINFIGLTVALSCCALVVLYVQYELSYDRFHHNPENTYRVAGQAGYGPWFPMIDKNYSDVLFQNSFPEIDKVARFRRSPRKFIRYKEKQFSTSVLITDHGSQFFDIFDFKLKEGAPSVALKEPLSAVITEQVGSNLLGEQPHLGKIIKWDTLTLQVTGVLEKLPQNSHLEFGMLITNNRSIRSSSNYVTLQEGASPKALARKIRALDVATNIYDTLLDVKLQRLSDMHFEKALTFEIKPPGNKNYLYLFSGIALFILIISCTNYMNLSAAIYAGRNKEIAVRKVLGGSKKSLSTQFLVESVLLALLTLPVVIFVIESVIPHYSDFLNIPLKNKYGSSLSSFSTLLGITLITGILAGIYPVFSLSHLSPLNLFRKGNLSGKSGVQLRKVLLTLQFTILIILGTGAFFIDQQLRYIKNKDLGIDRSGLIKISNVYGIEGNEKYNAIKSRFLSDPNILGFTTGMAPGTEDYGTNYIAEGHEQKNDALTFGTDFDYFSVTGVKPLYGDFFEKSEEELPNISLLVNEHFVNSMGWKNPIGKKITLNPGPNQYDRFIAGVFQDYHARSLHEAMVPQFIFARKTRRYPSENLLIKINMENIQASFESIEKAWYEFQPDSPIHYEFVDKDIQSAYQQEQKMGTLSNLLSILAIVLAIMGLVGLTAYIAQLRTKEIGVRKVLGAPTSRILFLLNKDFIPLIIISTIIASSVSFYMINHWLNSFAYRTEINAIVFPLAGISVLLITSITICLQATKTALQNPIVALRQE